MSASPANPLQVVRGACGHDCPDTCSWVVEVRDGTAERLSGDPAHPFTRGTLCAKVNHYLERVYHPERVLHPLKRAGREGRGTVRSRQLGRSARRHRVALARDRRGIGRRGHPAVQLGGRAGADSDGLDRPATVRIDGLQRPRSQHLRRGGRRGPVGHDRLRHRHRSGRDRPQPVHRAVGDEHDRHEPALLAAGARSAASRREARGRGSDPNAHRGGRRLARADQARQRRGAGAGDDARDDSRRPGGPRVRVAARHRLRSPGGTRTAVLAGAGVANGRLAGRGDRAVRPRVRDDAAVAAAAADRHGAPSQRRDAVPHAGMPARC